MRRVVLCLVALLVVRSMHAQAPAASGPVPMQRPPLHKPGATSNARGSRYKPGIPVSAPIITLEGVCAQPEQSGPSTKAGAKAARPAAKPASCKTVVTRGQLEALSDAVEPNAVGKAHQQFALNYARLLAATQIAEDKRLELNPEVQRAIQVQQKLVRMQVLTDYLLRGLEREAAHVPDREVEAYYRQYLSTFEQAQASRVVVALDSPTEGGKRLDAEAVKAKMQDLRDRALKGEEFDALQASAYKDLGIKGNLPPTTISLMRRGVLAPEEVSVFEMSLGDTTPVFENQGLVSFLRVITRRTQSLDEVKTQIQAVLLQQRVQEELRAATKGISAEFDLKYIESPSQPDLFPPAALTLAARRGLLTNLHAQP